jgi:anti-anti-sigma factor
VSLDLDIKREKNDDKIILRLYGRIDGATAPRLASELNLDIDKGHTHILIDFSEVDYLSSAGLRVLLAATKKHKALYPEQSNGRLALFSLKEHIRGIVHDAGFDRAFRLCEGEKDALLIQ